jgi:hypothetical protein
MTLAVALVSAGGASAQYTYNDAYEDSNTSEETMILIEEAVEAVADDLYEELVEELECENALGVGCSKTLPVTGSGSDCSCSATGPNAACAGPFKNKYGQVTHIFCSDGKHITTCRYTGPFSKPYDSCACATTKIPAPAPAPAPAPR